jgi:hypothetical protein
MVELQLVYTGVGGSIPSEGVRASAALKRAGARWPSLTTILSSVRLSLIISLSLS